MHYRSLLSLLTARAPGLPSGALALIFVEDDTEIASTIHHHAALGFAAIVVFCPAQSLLPATTAVPLYRVDHDPTRPGAVQEAINALIAARPQDWLYFCYNAEYLFYPFSESRSITEMLGFVADERRDSVTAYVIDLYARDLARFPDGVALADAWFDGTAYFATDRQDRDWQSLDRQIMVQGGLRWRLAEHIPPASQALDRIALFRAARKLQIGPDLRFNDAEYNTYRCLWHHSLTVAICSFRTAKALRRNPRSRAAVTGFHWQGSVPCRWQAQQLLDLGMMEPGQWF